VRVVIRIAVVLLLVLSLGLHWAFLQTVAWTGMLVRYTQEGTFTEAVSKTFDGEHPCKMCQFVEQGRAQERQPEQQAAKTSLKLEPGLVWREAVVLISVPHGWVAGNDTFSPSHSDQPPKPRPRGTFFDLQTSA
jgi:hypothetical protein